MRQPVRGRRSEDFVDDSELKGILDRVQQWGIAADNKVNVLTAIQAAVFAFILPKTGDWIQRPSTSNYMSVALALGLLLLVAALGASVAAIFPRTKNPHRLKSVTFFGDINAMTAADYRKKLDAMTPPRWKEDYISQIHTNSIITTRKHHTIKIAVALFTAGLGVLGACYGVAVTGGW
jgi:hypothetical protein